MTRIVSCLPVLLLAVCLSVAPAKAQSSRTFVSAAGSDANDCSRFAPCRTFQGAHDKTNPDGEVTVLDAGGYGSLKITKSISIVNDGAGEASILVSGGGTGVTINGGSAAYMNLRGITIQGIGFGGGTGLVFDSGFALTMTNCVIRNHTGNGIHFVPVATGVNNHLAVSNTVVADNGGAGIFLKPSGTGSAKIAFSRVEIYNNSGNGISADGTSLNNPGIAVGTVTDSVIFGNGGAGVLTNALFQTANAGFVVVRSLIANNATALSANGAILVSESTLARNVTTWQGSVLSFGDNVLAFNDDLNPAPPLVSKK